VCFFPASFHRNANPGVPCVEKPSGPDPVSLKVVLSSPVVIFFFLSFADPPYQIFLASTLINPFQQVSLFSFGPLLRSYLKPDPPPPRPPSDASFVISYFCINLCKILLFPLQDPRLGNLADLHLQDTECNKIPQIPHPHGRSSPFPGEVVPRRVRYNSSSCSPFRINFVRLFYSFQSLSSVNFLLSMFFRKPFFCLVKRYPPPHLDYTKVNCCPRVPVSRS